MVGLSHNIHPPSAADHTPSLEINHENAEGLPESCFEGPEKLLEIWFAPHEDRLPESAPREGMRAIGRSDFESMLDFVQCKILSVIQGEDIDAYLLSESSLFVTANKVILKTCGTTTLLAGIARLLDLAQSIGFPKDPWRVFYSRKSFMFPEKQSKPHSSWEEEVQVLNTLFRNGSAYLIGAMNNEHWHLFLTQPTGDKPSGHDLPQGFLQDETVEILMSDLDIEKAQQFYASEETSKLFRTNNPDPNVSEGHFLGSITSSKSGLAAIYPRSQYPAARMDSYLFNPCGYSANGVVPHQTGGGGTSSNYFTVHVTPEPYCSYASFETNVSMESLEHSRTVLTDVLDVFRPGRFCVSFFESKPPPDLSNNHNLTKAGSSEALKYLKGYKRMDRIVYDLIDYELVFASFEKV